MFAVGVGSSGAGEPRFAVRIPFRPSPGRQLIGVGREFERQVGDHTAWIEPHAYGGYFLVVDGFETEDAARDAFQTLVLGLSWICLIQRFGLDMATALGETELFEAPKEDPGKPVSTAMESAGWDAVDGHYDIDKAAVVPEHKRLVCWETGQPSVTITVQCADILAATSDALALPNVKAAAGNDRLQLALELYSESFFEASRRASFVGRVTVLEALAGEPKVSDVSEAAIRKAHECAKNYRDENTEKTSTEHSDLNRLLDRIAQLKRDSGAGVSRSVAMKLTGHKTEAVYRRYAIADSAALAEGVEKLARLYAEEPHERKVLPLSQAGNGTNTAQSGHERVAGG